MADWDDVGHRYCSLGDAEQLRLLPIWVERIAFMYSNLWIGPMALGLKYQSYLGQASELLFAVTNKRMTKHQFELEHLEDRVEKAAFAARFEANGRAKVLLAASIADTVQLSLNVHLGRVEPLTALTHCFLVMEDLGEPTDILCNALGRDIDYVTGVSDHWHFRPLWREGRPPGWPGQGMSHVSYYAERLDPANLFKAAVRVLSPERMPSPVQNPNEGATPPSQAAAQRQYDVFISHASADKDKIVRALAEALRDAGLSVWYDEFELRIGDSLSQKIDKGLANSKFGIVVLSKGFFAGNWPERELRGLVTRTISGEQVILPIWHEVTKQEVIDYSPPLADSLAMSTATHTVQEIAAAIVDVIRSPRT